MKKADEYEELLACFARHDVRYLVIGAHALAFWARPRYTKDFDLFVEPSRENARRILRALEEFGFGEVGLGVDDFAEPGRIVQLGVAPKRVDLATSIDGVMFEQAWENRVEGRYGAESTWFLSRADLVRNKKASGRPQDLADLAVLELEDDSGP